MSAKIDKDKSIQLARDFFKLPAEKEVDSAFTRVNNDVQYWWVIFAFPTEYIYPEYNFLIARVNETTGEVERMPSI